MASNASASYDPFAEFYDAADLDRRAAIDFYCGLPGPETTSLLDIGCGTGTITIPVARRIRDRHPRARVVGVDLSPNMLDQARSRSPTLEWVVGDMRSPPVDGRFDLILCCYHTLQICETDGDLLQVFKALRTLVAPDGRLAFDIYQPNLGYLRSVFGERPVRHFTARDGRQMEMCEKLAFEEHSRVLVGDWNLFDLGRPEAGPVVTLHSRSRQYFPSEIEHHLAASGWRLGERYGFYDRSPFTPASKKQVVVAVPA